ncbi:MAG: hypothetical protein JO219_08065 [Candidatus Eremiobacteraeota bacterium]|nr:hypothetical protein [Candidatus Eremiobacteraeota bacterium]
MSACAKKETTAPPAAASPTASQAVLPVRHDVDFNFSDVAVTTSAAPLLRLGFSIHNVSKDPIQCDPSEFSITLSNGSTVQADQSADNKCDPDSIDPGATGNAIAFFDLASGYTGDVTLSMTVNDAVVGKGTTQVK